MIAALPMYDWAVSREANDRFWALIRDGLRAGGIEAPEALDHGTDLLAGWTAPDLVLSQLCGLVFSDALKGRVTYVATPDYGLPGAPPGHYRSHLVARRDEGRPLGVLAANMAFNSDDSQSGWGSAVQFFAPLGVVPRGRPTGAHRNSAIAVAEGRADLAAIDAVTWRLLADELPETAAALRIVDTTRPTPAPPMITAKGRDPAPLRAAIASAYLRLAPADRQRLGIVGFADIPAADYYAVPLPPAAQGPAGNT